MPYTNIPRLEAVPGFRPYVHNHELTLGVHNAHAAAYLGSLSTFLASAGRIVHINNQPRLELVDLFTEYGVLDLEPPPNDRQNVLRLVADTAKDEPNDFRLFYQVHSDRPNTGAATFWTVTANIAHGILNLAIANKDGGDNPAANIADIDGVEEALEADADLLVNGRFS